MAESRAERRLAAILAADVAGYSRLMGADEEGTLAQLKAHRKELIDPKIAEYRGRIVKTTGDGLLIEFASVVDAVRCAVDIQRGMAERNSAVLQDRSFQFRVGINVGDVVIEDGDIFGDGVNIASRLESIAEPGGICVSDDAYRQFRGKLALDALDMGEQQLKNIAQPVRVYKLRSGAPSLAATTPRALTLPDKPSIAVLAFQNMSGDPEQEYFADGRSEEIITALSRIRWLFVIARNSSFTYKGRAIDIKQVSRELGVRYVLEGSVRKAANRVRITGQLIDSATGAHLWADRFDGTLNDVFELQDQVTASVVGAIGPRLVQAEIERARRKPTENLDAYDYYLRGLENHYRWTREATDEAIRSCHKAIELDPNFGSAYGIAARCRVWRLANRWCDDIEQARAETTKFGWQAVRVGADDPSALAGGGFALAMAGSELEAGASFIDRALAIDQNFAAAWHLSAFVRLWLGQPEIALDHDLRSLRLSPIDPRIGQVQTAIAFAHFNLERFDDAAEWGEKGTRTQPNWPLALGIAAASFALSGRQDEAQRTVARLRELDPIVSISTIVSTVPFRRHEDIARWADGLRRAGLPE